MSIMAAVLLCTSCDDYLDVSSPSKFDRDYVFSTEAEMETAGRYRFSL